MMSLKPVIAQSGSQNNPVAGQLNKPMHSQGHSAAYGQPPSHMPQNLASNLSHNQNPVHNSMPHHLNPHAHGNHYSLTVPNAPQHYPNPNIPQAHAHAHAHAAHINSHMGSNMPQHQAPPMKMHHQFGMNYNQSHIPTVDAVPQEKPQSNGAPEAKSDTQHYVPPKEKPSTPERPIEMKAQPAPAIIEPPVEPKEHAAELPQENSNNTAESSKMEAVIPTKEASAKPQETPKPAATPEKSENAEVPSADKTDSNSVPKEDVAKEVVQMPEEKNEKPEETQNQPAVKEQALKLHESEDVKKTDEGTAPEVPSTPTKATSSPAKSNSTTPRSAKKTKTPPKSENDTPRAPKREKPSTSTATKTSSDPKAKRQRTMTQHYQSPLPELEMITKIAKSSGNPKPKNADEKLIVFYKNEFLAVRNAEGGFYVCQSVQNIYKSTLKIKIRWLSQDKNDKSGETFTPDFYDITDFDCILTNLNLERIDKGQYRLPAEERLRTDNILKRALAVENGEEEASLTEEHPDGLDVSLYKEESQLKKRKATKRKSKSALKKSKKLIEKSPIKAKVRKTVEKPAKKVVKKATIAKKATPISEPKKTSVASGSRADRAKRRQDSAPKTSPVVDQKKAKVLAKVARKTAIPASKISPKATKTAPKASTSAKSAKAAKPATTAKKTKRSTRK